MSNTLSDWVVPVVGLLAFGIWLVITRAALRQQLGTPAILVLATITIVAAAIAFSSLTFPSLIGPDLSRGAVVFARATLLVGGLAVLWASRRRM